jgi:hypothetical protein
MAKGNLFLGMARGKVGSVVFSRLEGQQVSRAYNSQVANPKSVGQRIQRAVFATATRASKFMTSIVDHSFFGVKDGPKCVRRFVELNSKYLLQQYKAGELVGLNPKGVNMLMPSPYKVSTGNLGTLNVPQLIFGASGDDPDVNLPLGGFGTGTQAASGKTVLASIGAQPGDQLSVVAIIGKLNSDTPTETKLLKSRVVFSSTADTDNVIELGDVDSMIPALLDPSIAYDGVITFRSSRNKDWFCIDIPEGYTLLAGTWILSRYNSTKKEWDYSEQTMLVWEDLEPNAEDAIASYDNAVRTTDSDYFLDGADATVTTEQTNDSPYPSYAKVVFKNAAGEAIYQQTVLNTGGALEDVTWNEGGAARLVIVSSKVRGAGYPGITVKNSNNEDVASQDPNATNNIEFDIELNPAAQSTEFGVTLASRFQDATSEAVRSTFTIRVVNGE